MQQRWSESVSSLENKCLQKNHYSVQLLKSHYFRERMHLANASTVSNNELYVNASCHFRNRRWHLFLKWQTSLFSERTAGGKLVSCDCCSPSSLAVALRPRLHFKTLFDSENSSHQHFQVVSVDTSVPRKKKDKSDLHRPLFSWQTTKLYSAILAFKVNKHRES